MIHNPADGSVAERVSTGREAEEGATPPINASARTDERRYGPG